MKGGDTKGEGKVRSFGLTNLSLRNSTSSFLLATLIAVLGIGSYISLPKELFPDIEIPTIYVSTRYPGNSPADMENLITRPLEKEIEDIEGIDELNSTSTQGFSAIVIEFNTGVDVQDALIDVRDAVDKAKKDLPDDLDQDPSVREVDFSRFPIFNINLSGDHGLVDLKRYAEELKDRIEGVPQINDVEIKGDLKREIRIKADLHKMQNRKVSFRDIEDAVVSENASIGAGDLTLGKDQRSVRIQGEFDEVSDMRNIVVKDEGKSVVHLKDVAKVVDGFKDRESYARLDGDPVISLDVIKKGGRNLLEATERVQRILDEAKGGSLPMDLKVTITNDQSDQVKSQISNLENNIISGVILVVMVLYFFLGFRNALFVGVAIPMSMFLSFLVISGLGYPLNLVILFALILALGMLVDNAIVGIENIYRLYHEEGLSAFDAAKRGIGEIALPIISSTATTLAAFFPLVFWDSIIGEFMYYLPITLIIVLTSSLFVALVINPVVAKSFLSKEDPRSEGEKQKRRWIATAVCIVLALLAYAFSIMALGNLLVLFGILVLLDYYFLGPVARWFQYRFLPFLERIYIVTLRFALSAWRPYAFFLGMVCVMILSIWAYFQSDPETEFFPVNEPKYINVFVELPVGTDIAYTDSITREIEKELHGILEPHQEIVTSRVANVGKGTSDPAAGPESMGQGKTPERARITVSFKKYEERKGKRTRKIMKQISSELQERPGVSITVKKNREGPPVGRPINIELKGPEMGTLFQEAERMKRIIASHNIPGIEELKTDVKKGKPEMRVAIDRQKAGRYGVSTSQIGSELRTAILGKEISKYKEGEEDYDIRLLAKDTYRHDISSLMDQRITFRDPSTGRIVQVPISSVAEHRFRTTYGSIKRKGMERVITVHSNVVEGYNSTEINQRIERILQKEFDPPEGYSYRFTGKQKEQAKSMDFLIRALLIAVSLITLILVSQFNSLFKPIIIVISVLFSTTGVFLGLGITGMDFVVIMTGIGIVSLAGIVVNNSIVLIDYIDLKRRYKEEEKGAELDASERFDAIVEGGRIRLRPVLLTAITTVLGLIPLAIGLNIDFYGLISELKPDIFFGGDNANFWSPMAWTVIFGLTFATFLTLVMVPVMYMIMVHMKDAARSLLGRG
ncbi:MAG: efflux RND transporter permease subunit [Flavobacteriales bacterium]